MAIGTTVELIAQTGGSDTNGGGFVTGGSGTNYSRQVSAQYSVTNGVATTGSAVIATTSASADMVNNLAYIAGGTGSITGNWYQITAVSVGVSITLDASTGIVTGTGVTINVGGSLATLGKMAAIISGRAITGGFGYCKYAAGAPLSISTNIGWTPSPGTGFVIAGYATTPGDNGFAYIQPGASSFTMLSAVTNTVFKNIYIQNGGARTSIIGFYALNSTGGFENCVVDANGAASWTGFSYSNYGFYASRCQAKTCATGFLIGNSIVDSCHTFNCTTGVSCNANSTSAIINCLIVGGTTGVSCGGNSSGAGLVMINNTISGTSSHSVNITQGNYTCTVFMRNNIFANAGAYGANASAAIAYVGGGDNAYFNCTSGFRNNVPAVAGDFTQATGDPFVDSSSLNFTLDPTKTAAYAGVYAVGVPQTFLGAPSTLATPSMGAAEYHAAGGSSKILGTYDFMGGFSS